VLLSLAWHSDQRPAESPAAGTDRGLSLALVVLLVIQLVLGAILRHVMHGLQIHITLAVVVLTIAVVVGVRAWGIYPQLKRVSRAGLWLTSLAGLQLCLGLAALLATGANLGTPPTAWNLILATAHQTTGALLLALAVYLTLWLHRLVVPAASGESA
jgi:heme A synthase